LPHNVTAKQRKQHRKELKKQWKQDNWKYSRACYLHKTGQQLRSKQLEADFKTKLQDSEFAAAVNEVNKACTKTHCYDQLLASQRVRALQYTKMYAFYGQIEHARSRFLNYIGAQRELRRQVDRISPPATRHLDYVVVGNAEFCSSMKGQPSGVSGKMLRALETILPAGHVIKVDEFRTSLLDSQAHIRMYHPPKRVPCKDGRVRTFGIHGIYQASMAGYSCTWNRDINAAINIRQNFSFQLKNLGNLPEPFRRSFDTCIDEYEEKHDVRHYKYQFVPVLVDGVEFAKFKRVRTIQIRTPVVL
jgi:hypothetical protein